MLSKMDDGKWTVHIVDFGIAKVLPRGRGAVQHLTQTGEIFGSPLYMSPEQCKGKPVDERSDIYSLGCVMFEALTGHPPHKGESAIETLMFHVNEEAPKVSQHRSEIDQGSELEQIIAKTLVADPDARYQKIEQVHADLSARKFTGQNITGSPSKTLGLSGSGSAKSKEDAQAITQATTVPQLRKKVLRDTFMTPILIAGAAAVTVWVVSALNIKQPPVAVVSGLNDEKLHEADLEFQLAKEKVAQGFTQEAAEYAQKALDLRLQLAPNSLVLSESQNQRADIAIKDAEHERSLLLQKQTDTTDSAAVVAQIDSRKKRITDDYALAEKLLKSAISVADIQSGPDKSDAPVRFRNNLVTAYLDQDKFKPAEQALDEISELYLKPDANSKVDSDTTQRNFHELFDGQYERLYWGVGREVDAAKLRLAHHKPERTGESVPVDAKEPFTGIWSYGTFSVDLHQTGNRISGQTPANSNQSQKPGEEPNAIVGDINGAVAHLTITNTSDVRVSAVAVQLDDYLVFHVTNTAGGNESSYVPDDAILTVLPASDAPPVVDQNDGAADLNIKKEPVGNSNQPVKTDASNKSDNVEPVDVRVKEKQNDQNELKQIGGPSKAVQG